MTEESRASEKKCATFMALVPKSDDYPTFESFRHISLCVVSINSGNNHC